MRRHYRIQSAAAKDARREAYAAAHADEVLPPDPGDQRKPWTLKIDYADTGVDWIMRKRRGNVRQWGAFDASDNPVIIDGRHLIGGKDEILRAAAKLLPSYGGMVR